MEISDLDALSNYTMDLDQWKEHPTKVIKSQGESHHIPIDFWGLFSILRQGWT